MRPQDSIIPSYCIPSSYLLYLINVVLQTQSIQYTVHTKNPNVRPWSYFGWPRNDTFEVLHSYLYEEYTIHLSKVVVLPVQMLYQWHCYFGIKFESLLTRSIWTQILNFFAPASKSELPMCKEYFSGRMWMFFTSPWSSGSLLGFSRILACPVTIKQISKSTSFHNICRQPPVIVT